MKIIKWYTDNIKKDMLICGMIPLVGEYRLSKIENKEFEKPVKFILLEKRGDTEHQYYARGKIPFFFELKTKKAIYFNPDLTSNVINELLNNRVVKQIMDIKIINK